MKQEEVILQLCGGQSGDWGLRGGRGQGRCCGGSDALSEAGRDGVSSVVDDIRSVSERGESCVITVEREGAR